MIIEVLRAAGNTTRYTELPGVGHSRGKRPARIPNWWSGCSPSTGRRPDSAWQTRLLAWSAAMRTLNVERSRFLLRLPQLLLLASLVATTGLAQPKSNFVFILTDDQGWSQLSFAMDPEIGQAASEFLETPNMARLAEQGMRFTSGYSPAPLCTPTRRSIFCGMTPARQRGTEFASEFDWEGRLTLPRALKQADRNYRTAHFGKFGSQMGADPEQVGFDESDGWTTNSTGGMPTPMEERGRSVTKQDPKLAFSITERAIDFVKRQVAERRPFYVQLSHYAAHLQVQTRPGSLERFEKKGSPDRAVTHAFGGMLYDLDEAVGRMLDALKELGAAENTYVILMGDNGGRGTIPGARDSLAPPNRPLNGAKHYLLEGGIRVPFLVTGPGVEPNSVSRVPVTGYDLLPTLYDLAGGTKPLPAEVDGGSFRIVLEHGGVGKVERAFGGLVFHRPKHRRDPASAIRVGDHKLLLRYPTATRARTRVLFDLAADPLEKRDLREERAEKADELERMLLGYLKSVGAEEASRR